MIVKIDFKRYITEATAAALIKGATAVGGAAITGTAQASMNRKTREFNQQEAEKARSWSNAQRELQNQWNMQMWKEEMAYNNPTQQVQRLRDAGLNPLFYGLDGNSVSQAQPAAQPLGYERANATDQPNPFAVGLGSAAQIAQIENIEAQTNKVKSETKAIDAKLPFEVDSLKAQIRNSNLSGDAQEIVNRYLDEQQDAEIRVKNYTISQLDAVTQKCFAEIEKMNYEDLSMMIGWLETNERILNLQKQRELSDKQMEELSSLIAVNNQTAKKLGLDVENYEDVQVVGTASHSMHFGPFSVSEGDPITLAMIKAARQKQNYMKDKQDAIEKKHKPQSLFSGSGAYTGPIYD